MATSATISLRQLQLFVALAKSRSFSRTAEGIGITQPALSVAIRQLEERLSIKLMHRTSHHVSLTTAGETLLPQAERLLNTADHAFESMHETVLGHHASVRIGATPSTMHLMAKGVKALQARGIQAQFFLCDGTAGDLLQKMRSGELDIVLGIHFQPIKDLDITPLFRDEFVLMVSREHRFAKAKTVAWSALADEEIVHFRHGSIGSLSTSALQQHALAISPHYHVEQLTSLHGLVQANLVVGITPRLYARDLNNGEVRLIRLVEPVVYRQVSLFRYRQGKGRNPLVDECYRALVSAIKVPDEN